MGTNTYAQSLEGLRRLGRSNQSSNAIRGISDAVKAYSVESRYESIEDSMRRAMDQLAMSNVLGMTVNQHLATVDAVNRVVERRNAIIREKRAQGCEGFRDAKLIVDSIALATESKAGEFFKKILAGIAEAFRRLISLVTNTIKTIITWAKSKTVKRQAQTYEKYKNYPKKDGWENDEVSAYPYKKGLSKTMDIIKVVSAQAQADKVRKIIESYKNSRTTQKYGMVRGEGNALQRFGAKINKATGIGGKGGSADGMFKRVSNEVEEALAAFNVKGKDGKESAAMWNGNTVYNIAVFGTQSPEKKTQKAGDLVKGICGSKSFEMLSASKTAEILKIVAAGKKTIHSLTQDVKFVEKLAKEFAGVREARSEEYTEISKSLNKLRSFKSVMSNNLMSCFMNYVRMRTYVYNIFVKAVRESDSFKTRNSKNGAYDTKRAKNEMAKAFNS